MKCYKCNTELNFSVGEIVGRSAYCNSCNADIRCCLNCKFYNTSNYNECSEPQAERVVDKTKSNFCDYFSLGENSTSNKNGNSASNTKEQALKNLDELFK
jgi:hypothetical protein